jgi:hypothetical protein
MTQSPSANHMDVSNTVNVTDPVAVGGVLREVLGARYKALDVALIDVLVADFSRLYRGEFPGFKACDLNHHDLQHVLDVTLAMVRLMDGHDKSRPEAEQLGPDLALIGIACALFHDSGYIRRTRDTRNSNGAAYTRIHVSRSARFMSEYLPTVGLTHIVPTCQRLVHFTGYEINPEKIAVSSDRERMLGNLLGTADLIAQMADREYLRKCHDHLYEEFEAGGMAGVEGEPDSTGVVYRSAAHLLESTPNFIREAIAVRLEGYFDGVYRYAGEYFGGPNLYMEAIADNSDRLQKLLSAKAREPVHAGQH